MPAVVPADPTEWRLRNAELRLESDAEWQREVNDLLTHREQRDAAVEGALALVRSDLDALLAEHAALKDLVRKQRGAIQHLYATKKNVYTVRAAEDGRCGEPGRKGECRAWRAKGYTICIRHLRHYTGRLGHNESLYRSHPAPSSRSRRSSPGPLAEPQPLSPSATYDAAADYSAWL